MAVGYHKLNTSAARSRPVKPEISESTASVCQRLCEIKKGSIVNHVKFGVGLVLVGCDFGGKLTVDFDGVEKVLMSQYVEVL